MVEQANKELDMEDIGVMMDSALEQDKGDCELEEKLMHPDYIHLDTDGVEQSKQCTNQSSIFKKIVIPGKAELREETRKLDKFQREVVNIAVKYAKDLVKSRRNINNLPTPVYLLGHGGAGAGKSTVIDIISKWCQSILSKEGDDPECPCIVKLHSQELLHQILEAKLCTHPLVLLLKISITHLVTRLEMRRGPSLRI